MAFTNEKPLIPFDVTAEWLFSKTEMRRPRMFIRGHHLLVREKEDFPNGPVEKYRFLGYNLTSYTFRIVKVT